MDTQTIAKVAMAKVAYGVMTYEEGCKRVVESMTFEKVRMYPIEAMKEANDLMEKATEYFKQDTLELLKWGKVDL